jgi:proteic killer suppression protein
MAPLIRSFGDRLTEEIFHGVPSRGVKRLDGGLVRAAVRKLDMLNAADHLLDLISPPGNRLEALAGDLRGFHSIRVNQQWRLIFRWDDSGCDAVQLIDYHA